MARKTIESASGIYVARNSFACEIGNERYNVSKGERVREGHELLIAHPDQFESLESGHVHYDVEKASAAPGEKRAR